MGRHFEVRAAAMQKTANAKAKVYSRFGKEILMAAKAGVPDPDMNMPLKKVIERAKANQVPADVIKRAIEKAKGGSTENYSAATYEGFGSNGGATVIIDCLTDNANRTIADLRACFNKSHAKLGVAGCASFNYEHVGLIVIKYTDEEAMMDALIMGEVELKDIEVDGEDMTITVESTDLNKAKEAVEGLIPGVEFEVMEDTMIPNEYITLEGEDLKLFQRLVTLLDDVDDVQQVYHNCQNINDPVE
ncbi:YebC/PmpR family DNA-binding transcriptional regulator [Amedibacillus sp. YH-ame6]